MIFMLHAKTTMRLTFILGLNQRKFYQKNFRYFFIKHSHAVYESVREYKQAWLLIFAAKFLEYT